VAVADVCHPPIEKPCGEGLMPDAIDILRRLGVVLPPNAGFPMTGIRFLGADAAVEASFPNGIGVGIRRRVLHEALTRSAEAAGAALMWGARVTGPFSGGVMINGQPLRCHWVVGADGERSQIRRWTGLDQPAHYARRFGFRRHFLVPPWTDRVEVHWGRAAQFYVTPVSPREVCVVLLSRDRHRRIRTALSEFPDLQARLDGAPSGPERGALSVSQQLRCVARGNVALVGDCSGSVDAVTGEGLCLAFRQAEALASAIDAGDLRLYAAAHRRFLRRPALMARLLLTMDRFDLIRRRALRTLSAKPEIFANLLAAHVAGRPAAELVVGGIVPLGLSMLAVR